MSDERTITSRGRIWFAAAIIAGATLLAYQHTFSAPFIFDDIPAITDNPRIHDLTAWKDVLLPSSMRGSGVAGRPLINLSLAINYALGGEKVGGYHAFNFLVHIAAGLALFGLVRRTLQRPATNVRYGAAAFPLAFAVALLWTLHPLQTESVTFVEQRTESLMGLFYLLTLYAFVRGSESPVPGRWLALSWLACLFGMASKEVMVSAPLIVLLYDRTFVAGSVAAAWRRRGKFYLALAATWGLLAFVMLGSEGRGGTVGFGHGVTAWDYALTQCRAIALYLRLALWPHPLVLDYGTGVVREPLAVLPQGLLLLALGAATLFALWRRPVLGFVGAWFFAILAPSSSVVPLVTQTMAEHRMYLPLAAVVALGVGAIHALAGRRSFPLLAVLAAVLGLVTYLRNEDYRSAETIWRDTVAKRPNNERAYHGLGAVYDEQGRHAEAIGYYETALKLKPDYAESHSDLAHDLVEVGRLDEALTHYREAARLQPEMIDPHVHLGALFVRLGRTEDAIREYEEALRRRPESAEENFNLAQVYFQAGRGPEAIRHYELAAKYKPEFAETHYRLGNARVQARQLEQAVLAYREAVRIEPKFYEAQMNLAGALLLLGRPAEAAAAYERVLGFRSGDPMAQTNLERAQALVRAEKVP